MSEQIRVVMMMKRVDELVQEMEEQEGMEGEEAWEWLKGELKKIVRMWR